MATILSTSLWGQHKNVSHLGAHESKLISRMEKASHSSAKEVGGGCETMVSRWSDLVMVDFQTAVASLFEERNAIY